MRVKTWHKLLSGLPVRLDSPAKAKASQRLDDILLCERQGWTEAQLLHENSESFYQDMIKILTLQGSIQEAKQKAASKRGKRR